jgi:hypothetical protein
MANSITSDLTISTAVTVLEELLAPIGAMTRNITNEIQPRRQSSVDVPIVKKDDSARDYSYSTGYNTTAETDVSTVTVPLVERIKPFHLADSDLNKSPITLQSYISANAHEFGRYILSLVFAEVDSAITAGSVSEDTVDAGSTQLSNIQGLQDTLDTNGAPFDRFVLMNSSVNSALMPASIETFGPSVLQGGRFGRLYGMDTYVTTVGNASVGDAHTFAGSSDSIIVANRMPDVQGQATLEEYTPFTIDGIGLQCAYRRYYEPSKGETFAAFTTIFGAKVAKPEHLASITRVS